MKEHDFSKHDQISNETQITNKPQILEEAKNFSDRQI